MSQDQLEIIEGQSTDAPHDTAAQAFADLSGKVEAQAAVLHELKGLVASLSQMVQANVEAQAALARTPALRLTPAQHAAHLSAAASEAAEAARAQWAEPTQDAIKQWNALLALNNGLRKWVVTDRRNRWAAWATLALGLLLYPTTLARTGLGIQIATFAVGRTDPWQAGNDLMNAAHPDIVAAMVAAQKMSDDNAVAAKACREAAKATASTISCMFMISNGLKE